MILDAARLDPERTTIRLMRAGEDPAAHADPNNYLPFTTASLRAVRRITVAAVHRLERLGAGEPLFPWADVPHVLYRGSIPWDWFTASTPATPG